jgi:hypothetical protein
MSTSKKRSGIASRTFNLCPATVARIAWLDHVLGASEADGGFSIVEPQVRSGSPLVRRMTAVYAEHLDDLIRKEGERGQMLRRAEAFKLRSASKGEFLPMSQDELLRRARATSAVRPMVYLLADHRAEQPTVMQRMQRDLDTGKRKAERKPAAVDRASVPLGSHPNAAALRELFTREDASEQDRRPRLDRSQHEDRLDDLNDLDLGDA